MRIVTEETEGNGIYDFIGGSFYSRCNGHNGDSYDLVCTFNLGKREHIIPFGDFSEGKYSFNGLIYSERDLKMVTSRKIGRGNSMVLRSNECTRSLSNDCVIVTGPIIALEELPR